MRVAGFVDDDKLIASVQKRPLIYDTDAPDHSNRARILSTWKDISEEVGVEVQIVKDRWVSMRDYFRKKVREFEGIKTGKLNKKYKKWSLYDKLKFLMPHLRNIDGDGSSVKTPTSDFDTESEYEAVQIKTEHTDNDIEEVDVDDRLSLDSINSDHLHELGGSINGSIDSPIHELEVDKQEPETIRPSTKRQRSSEQFVSEAGPSPAVKRPRRKRKFVQQEREEQEYNNYRGESTKINTNERFLTSLIPLIETLDPLTAMEFRHDVHWMLLRYLRENRHGKGSSKIRPTATAQGSSRFKHNGELSGVGDASHIAHDVGGS